MLNGNIRFKYFNSKGQLHRDDGPAVVYLDGYKEYWIDGKNITVEVNSLINNGLSEIEALEILML